MSTSARQLPRRMAAAGAFVAVLSAMVLTGVATGAIPKGELDQAYRDFMAERFTAVVGRLSPYDRDRPRRLSADFMLAVSKCRVGQAADGRARLLRLQTDFAVTRQKSRDIAAQIDDCGVGELRIAGLDGKADGASARVSPAAPASAGRPQMSGLEPGWSYNQSDIYSKRASSALECSRICLDDARCRAMTYIESQRLCWVKDRIPAARGESSDMTSAIKLFD